MTVVLVRSDDTLVERVSSLTIAELRAFAQNRVFIGTELGYEFEMYVSRENIFLVRTLRNAPDEGDVYEGHLWVDTAQKVLHVGTMFNINGMEYYLRVSRFVVAYIDIPYGPVA